jgi:hypothetical protein
MPLINYPDNRYKLNGFWWAATLTVPLTDLMAALLTPEVSAYLDLK